MSITRSASIIWHITHFSFLFEAIVFETGSTFKSTIEKLFIWSFSNLLSVVFFIIIFRCFDLFIVIIVIILIGSQAFKSFGQICGIFQCIFMHAGQRFFFSVNFSLFFLFDIQFLFFFPLFFFLLLLFSSCTNCFLFFLCLFNKAVIHDFAIEKSLFNLHQFHINSRS